MISDLFPNQGQEKSSKFVAKAPVGMGIILGLVWGALSGLCSPINATEISSAPKLELKKPVLNPVIFRPRPRTDRPLQTAGAGTRSLNSAQAQCVGVNQPELTLVVPQEAANLTVTERPQFWFYLPETKAQALEFSLFQQVPNSLGESETGLYQIRLPIGQQGVVTSLTLPPDAPALVDNQTYIWRVSLICNPQNRLRDLRLSGTITKISLPDPQKAQLHQANVVTKVNLLASLGIWNDLISTLAQDQQLLQANWQNLLKSPQVGLDQLAEQFPTL